jgi:hypothetical protein
LQSSKITKLRRRIEQLESRLAFRREPAPIIVITYVESDGAGHPDPNQEIAYGTIGGLRFNRLAGETEEDFTDRIISTQKGRTSIVSLYCESPR